MSQQKRVKTAIKSVEEFPDLKIISKKIFHDNRGYFVETYNEAEWSEELNFRKDFKQDNHSFSFHGVLRGLHSQPGMGKLVSVISGEIFDVAVDIRPESATYGQWHSVILNEMNGDSLWIPDGFAHGFQCLSKTGAHVTYKCTAIYNPETEFGIDPLDKDIAIKWPIIDGMILSERDKNHKSFSEHFSNHAPPF